MTIPSCIRRALDDGELEPDTAAALEAEYLGLARTMGAKAAQDKLQKDLDIRGQIVKRQQLLMVQAHDQIVKNILQYRDVKGRRNIFRAAESHFEDFGDAGFPSARFIGEGLMGDARSRMATAMEHFDRKTFYSQGSLIGGRKNQVDLLDLQKAMFGERNVSPVSAAMAKEVLDTCDWLREMHNEVSGGTIGKLENWGGPQSHDPAAVIRAGGFKGNPEKARKAWSEFIDPLLDWAKIRDPTTDQAFGLVPRPERRMAILGHAWNTIITEGDIDQQPTQQRFGKTSVANMRSAHRYFVYKDADSKLAYNKEYGTGDLWEQIINHIDGMARDIALMKIFGPNPAAQLEWIGKLYSHEAAKRAVGETSQLESYPRDRRVLWAAERAKHRLDAYYQQYRGVDASDGWLALSGTILRNNAMGALLGSSAIAHADSNWFIQTMARRLGGIPQAKVIPELLASFNGATKAEILRAGLDCEQASFSLGASARRLGALQKAARWSRWLPDRTTHLTGLIPIVSANKAAFMRGVMSYFNDLQKTDWNDLPERIRSKLHGYGLREWEWKIIQLARTYEPDVGSAHWLRPTEIRAVGDEHPEEVLRLAGRTDLAQYVPGANAPGLSIAAEEEARKIAYWVESKFRGYMMGEREVAVPQSSIRARQFILGTTDPNTFLGQLRASAGMFKGFMGSMMVTQYMGMQRELARGRYKGTSYIAQFMIGMALLGILTLQLKQMAAGKDPLPMDPNTPEGRGTIIRGALTSGSFGIFGDFLQADLSSFGHGFLETLAGPGVMGVLDLLQGSLDASRRWFYPHSTRKDFQEIASDTARKLLSEHTPLLSTAWPYRAAYQRLVLDQLEYLTNPRAHYDMRTLEDRLRKVNGQRFYWPPGSLFPQRWPEMTVPPPR